MVQVATLAALGGYDRERLTAAAIATIPALLAMRPAMRLGKRLPQETFRSIVLVVLGLAAVRLIWIAL
jgi:uncharacterized membrane protein YfcA